MSFNYNFESDIKLSTDLAQINFDFFLSADDGYSKQPLYFGGPSHGMGYLVIYGDGSDKNDPHFKVSHLHKMKKDDLLELAYDFELYHLDDENYKKSEIIDELMDIDHEDYYAKYWPNTDYRDLDYDFSVRGYAQGDKVLVKCIGDVPYSEEYIEHIFYDCPISGTITVTDDHNKVEIYVDELLDDCYEWDKDDFIKKLAIYVSNTLYGVDLITWASENLPENLEVV